MVSTARWYEREIKDRDADLANETSRCCSDTSRLETVLCQMSKYPSATLRSQVQFFPFVSSLEAIRSKLSRDQLQLVGAPIIDRRTSMTFLTRCPSDHSALRRASKRRATQILRYARVHARDTITPGVHKKYPMYISDGRDSKKCTDPTQTQIDRSVSLFGELGERARRARRKFQGEIFAT